MKAKLNTPPGTFLRAAISGTIVVALYLLVFSGSHLSAAGEATLASILFAVNTAVYYFAMGAVAAFARRQGGHLYAVLYPKPAVPPEGR